ncbi:MAG: class I SAM-dependent methyltransferase [bacterium]|nr:class I SAM-dependent methyltransferase [bacterium]
MTRAAEGWQHPEVPAAQARLADRELVDWRAGGPHGPFDAARALLGAMAPSPVTLLEVGCGAAYYREIVHAVHPRTTYYGCDYAPGMVAQAHLRYPGIAFRQSDQRDLGAYADASMDCVWNGAALLHLLDADGWAQAIAEAVRVSRRWLAFHRVPVRPAGLPSALHDSEFYDRAAPTTIHERYVARAEWEALLAPFRVVQVECWSEPDADPMWESVLAEKR